MTVLGSKEQGKMKIIKRSGSEMTFNIDKISQAVSRANLSVPESVRLNELQKETTKK